MLTTALGVQSRFFLIFSALCFVTVSAEQQLTTHQSWSNLEDVLALRKFEDSGVDVNDLPVGFHKELMKILTFPTALHSGNNFTSKQCLEDSLFYVSNLLLKGSEWSIQMMGASGQLPGSIFGSGNYHAEGLFDECQAIRSVPSRFKGQYCTVFLNLEVIEEFDYGFHNQQVNELVESNPSVLFLLHRLFGPLVDTSTRIKPRLAGSNMKALIHNYPSLSICLPSSCSASDLGNSVAQLVGSYVISGNQSIVTIADEKQCFTDDHVLPPLDGPSITVILICSLIVLLVMLATIHEALRNYRDISFDKETDSTIVSVLHCFSAVSNTRKLLSLKSVVVGEDNLACLSGIRFIAATGVIFFHSSLKISSIGSNYLSNPNTFEQISRSFMYLTSTDHTFGLDTFFVMSAVLVSYNILNGLDYTSGKLSLIKLIIQRYFRITVVYALVLAIVSTIWIYFDQGPNWYYLFMMTEKCRINWWKHILYINNFYLYDMDECFSDSWFMAVDMQLFLFAPFLVYLLWRWKKTGLFTLAAFMLASLITLGSILYIFDLPENAAGLTSLSDWKKETSLKYLNLIYVKIWTRAPSYIIGLLTGWILYRAKQTKLKLSPRTVLIFWMGFFALFAYVFFGTRLNVHFEKSFPLTDKIVRLIYGTLHRTAWAIAVGWGVFACTHGYGGYLSSFLSWEGFLPFSRLTYCVYLLEWNFLTAYYASQRKQLFYTTFSYLTMIGGFIVVIYGLAFLLALFVETPSVNLMKFVLYKMKSKPRNK